MISGPSRRVIISGATGAIGAVVVDELAAQLPGEVEIVCLVRSRRSFDKLAGVLTRDAAQRIRPLFYDLSSDEDIGTSSYDLPQAQVSLGVHCAADVSWDKEYSEVENINVQGTLRFAELVRASSVNPRLIYVSSAYTSVDGWNYRNAYEQSKAAGERELRSRFSSVPTATFSCSLVIGRTADGAIQRFHGLYPLIKLLAQMPPPFMVGNSSCLVDIVPVDWVAAELVTLIRRAIMEEVVEPVIAAAGPRRMSAAAMLGCIEQRINRFRIRHGLAEMPMLEFIPYRRWAFLQRSLRQWQPEQLSSRDFRYFERLLAIYRPYIESATVLPPLNVQNDAPDAEPVLAKAVDYWLSKTEQLVLARLVGKSSRQQRIAVLS